jgi:hypothetical protein
MRSVIEVYQVLRQEACMSKKHTEEIHCDICQAIRNTKWKCLVAFVVSVVEYMSSSYHVA